MKYELVIIVESGIMHIKKKIEMTPKIIYILKPLIFIKDNGDYCKSDMIKMIKKKSK